MLTHEQINWAKDHDWFWSVSNGIVTVREYIHDTTTKEYVLSFIPFNNFRKLKEWAGY